VVRENQNGRATYYEKPDVNHFDTIRTDKITIAYTALCNSIVR